jgi:predicted ATPase
VSHWNQKESTMLKARLAQVTQRADVQLDLSAYKAETLDQIVTTLERYLAHPTSARPRNGWLPWRRSAPQHARVAPLLLTGPVGTGKTTLMMLLDRAVPEASSAAVFQQEIEAHPSTAENGSGPQLIEVRPLMLMGRDHNVATGVLRLPELQTFYRLFTYDRRNAAVDPEAARCFAQLFQNRIVFVDEFVPDTVTSFPMQVINHLADSGVQVVLSSNRRETPFIEGVQVVPVEGADMRVGDLSLMARPARPDPRFDRFNEVPPTPFHHIARGLQARLRAVNGQRWMHLHYADIANVPATWASFQRLLQHADVVLVDEVPIFDREHAPNWDATRRFVFLIDALYDERHPVLLRLTNQDALPEDFDPETLQALYLPELVTDLERVISRLRQLSALIPGVEVREMPGGGA